ncbi:hypothetical protein [Paractinoplanes durhamensis]|uniref:Holin n=1 Tax=Paractinoplanes durhamensis TaxID=113563 RepID=A0ABQ3YRE7_9ACTN|nr:hypothetical protein [Actinoplanes durhamensis]GIE00165.1 hypothetical protein Adu01nite_15150 [Actinoplanes durhamensis]
MIEGFVPTLLVGIVGAFLAEVIRVLPAVRKGKPPRGWDLVASLLQVVLGGGAVLFGWDQEQSALKVAVMGAAFPLLFSAAVDGAKPPSGGHSGRDVAHGERSVADYFAGRF